MKNVSIGLMPLRRACLALVGLIACVALQAQTAGTDTLSLLRDSLQTMQEQKETLEHERLQRRIWKDRAKYIYLGYGRQELKNPSGAKLSSDYSLMLVKGRTFYLHKKPLGGMVKFGIDWNQADLSFAKYPDLTSGESPDGSSASEEDASGIDLAPMQVDLGMGIGLSCTVNPVDHLKAGVYFHVTPTYSMVLQDEELYSNYATFFNTGLHVSYKVISLGFEMRWSTPVDYDGLMLDRIPAYGDAGSDDPFVDPFESLGEKTKNTQWRIMLGFRF